MKAEILILGVLHRGNLHPYEIKRRLANAMVECFTDVDVGTLYYAVRRLAQARLIEATARETVKRGGVRTVYRITAAGRRRFQQLLHEQLDAAGPVAATLYIPLLFLPLADRERLLGGLKSKLERQSAALEELRAIKRQLWAEVGTGGRYLLRHLEAQRSLDRRWLQGLIREVSGRGVQDIRRATDTPRR